RHVTRQRSAVFDFLGRVDHHPTAEEVYLGVRKRMKNISLATVYKNLEALVACEAATKLTYGDGAARYDIRTDPHFHTRCLSCGRVTDLEPGAHAPGLRRIRPHPGFKVTGFRLELLGHCRACSSKRREE
ncbi:MAG: transcriptional repressor, partial [Acidobacteria bacterium]|nr:transcriptional repressor [Acidobacteriota bacterium]